MFSATAWTISYQCNDKHKSLGMDISFAKYHYKVRLHTAASESRTASANAVMISGSHDP